MRKYHVSVTHRRIFIGHEFSPKSLYHHIDVLRTVMESQWATPFEFCTPPVEDLRNI